MDEVEKLIKQLKEKWPGKAIVRLGEIGDTRAVPALIDAIGAVKHDWVVGEAVLDALAKIGGARAFSYLIEMIWDESYLGLRAMKVLPTAAGKGYVDLDEVRATLRDFVENAGVNEREWKKQRATKAYAKIAAAVANRKKKQMDGILSTGKIKPPKKGMYRKMRRSFA